MPPKLYFLGTGDAKGVPRWWCNCDICQDARNSGHNRRSRASVLFGHQDTYEHQTEYVLIDTSCELRLQLDSVTNSLDHNSINSVLISHAHNDHIAGLPDLAMWAYTKKDSGFVCPLYSSKDVIDILESRFSFLKDTPYFPFKDIALLTTPLAGYTVEAIKVPHGFNGHSYAFLFTSIKSGKRWAYMSDCIGLEDFGPWYDLELLILGASFYKENQPIEGRSVYDVLEATELSQNLRAKQTILTHMGHGVDTRKEAPVSVRYAYDGLEIALPI